MAGYSGYCRLGFRRNGCGVTAVARSLDTTPFGLGRNKTNIYFKLYSHGVNKYRLENMKHKKHSITQYLMVFSIHWATMRAGYKMVPVSSLKKCPVFNVTTSGGVHRIDQGCSQGGLWGREVANITDVMMSYLHSATVLNYHGGMYGWVKMMRLHQYDMWLRAVWPWWWWWWWTDQDSLIAKADHSIESIHHPPQCTDHTLELETNLHEIIRDGRL